MQCKSCGSPLRIEDERCPFCGEPNPNFQQHREDMKAYSARFQKIKTEVDQKTTRFTRLTVPLTIILVLLLCNIVVFIAISQSWEVSSYFQQRNISKNLESHIQQMEALIAEKDYVGFSAYYTYNDLYISDELNSYDALSDASSAYSSLYRNIMEYAAEDYMSREDAAEYTARNLESLYDAENNFGKYTFREDDPAHLALIQDMKAKAHYLISAYFELPLETAETFPNLSNAKRQELMEKGVQS